MPYLYLGSSLNVSEEFALAMVSSMEVETVVECQYKKLNCGTGPCRTFYVLCVLCAECCDIIRISLMMEIDMLQELGSPELSTSKRR